MFVVCSLLWLRFLLVVMVALVCLGLCWCLIVWGLFVVAVVYLLAGYFVTCLIGLMLLL